MNTSTQPTSAAYFRVRITSSSYKTLLQNNSERAFVIDQLRQLLTYRSVFDDSHSLSHLAHHIDLLAFSVTKTKIELLCFAISKTSLQLLADLLFERTLQYRHDQSRYQEPEGSIIKISQLLGVHHALTQSVLLHLSHDDWEFDRYSSIGFYLHDRRGDWMRLWRITQIYDYSPAHYRRLLVHSRRYTTPAATLTHA